MALRSRDAFIHLPDKLGCDPVFTRSGWLFLVDEIDKEHAQTNRRMQLAEGSSSREVSPDELEQLVPGIQTEGIAYALFERDSGYADPIATTRAYLLAAGRLGARLFERTSVERIEIRNRRVVGVLVDHERIPCQHVVLAAGAWSKQLGEVFDLHLPIEITREQDVIYEAEDTSIGVAVSDQADRIYFRPITEEGNQRLLIGRGYPKPYEVVDPDAYDDRVDGAFEADVRQRLVNRIPRLSGLRMVDSRVGLYSVTPDWHPLLGPVEAIGGLVLATGGSGHCFKLGPAIGELLAGSILGFHVDYADIALFALDRFDRGKALVSTYGGNRA